MTENKNMHRKKICLFTAHSPMVGGGGVIIRSLVAHLSELEISWKYVADNPVAGYEDGWLGKGIKGAGLAKEMLQSWKMLSGRSSVVINELVEKLLAMDCDAYWVVSHNEGLRVALELRRLQTKRPVHITFHDDWAGALCARSFRYRLLTNWARRLTIWALEETSSFDVISAGMKKYYKEISDREGEICHRYLEPGSIVTTGGQGNPDTRIATITAGHIGSIYDKNDFLEFLGLFVKFARLQGKKAMLKMWGCHLNIENVPVALRSNIIFYNELPETQVIPLLARCDFVYSMYPFTRRLSRFAKTSLPTKLSSYVQAGRPVFGHGPADSTLADFLKDTGTGVVWSDNNVETGLEKLATVYSLHTDSKQWQMAREQYFGEKNLAVMRKALLAV